MGLLGSVPAISMVYACANLGECSEASVEGDCCSESPPAYPDMPPSNPKPCPTPLPWPSYSPLCQLTNAGGVRRAIVMGWPPLANCSSCLVAHECVSHAAVSEWIITTVTIIVILTVLCFPKCPLPGAGIDGIQNG